MAARTPMGTRHPRAAVGGRASDAGWLYLVRRWRWLRAHPVLLWTAVVVLVLVGYGAAVWAAPTLLGVPELIGTPGPGEVLTARHNARLLIISLAGALIVAVGLLYTARTYRLASGGRSPTGSPRPSSGSARPSCTCASAAFTPSAR